MMERHANNSGSYARSTHRWYFSDRGSTPLISTTSNVGMIAIPRKLIEYIAKNGINYFGRWVSKLTTDDRKTVFARLGRVRNGNFGYTKPLGEGVIELKIDLGPGFRVYFGLDGDEIVVLLAGGIKRSQEQDITLAKQLWNEYKKEKNNAGH